MSERPRLLVLTSTYPRWEGDPEPAFVHELARRLTDRFDVCVLGPHSAGAKDCEHLDGVLVRRYRYAPERWETLVNDGGMLANVRRSRWKWLLLPAFLLRQYFFVRRVVREFRPHVLHAHWLLPQGLVVAAAVRDIPWVVTSHGADLFALNGRRFMALRRWVVHRAAAITLVSEAMRQRLLDEQPDSQAVVLPMGVDTSQRFTPGVKRDKESLLFVGRLVEKKGLHHLLRALPLVVLRYPALTLTIIGFGPEQEHLSAIVRDLRLENHVSFRGALPQEALPSYYQRASLFVAPFVETESGDQEGLGLVVAEAMACACPVVVGDVPGVTDLVNIETGIRVSANDHLALANAITSLLSDPYRLVQFGNAGRRHIEAHFSWQAVSDRYADLLLRIGKEGSS